MTQMNAEIILDDRTLARGKSLLEQHGLEVTVFDFVLEEDPELVWVMAEIDTDMSDVDFLYWVSGIVDPVKGFVVEAGNAYRIPSQQEVLAATAGGATTEHIAELLHTGFWPCETILQTLEGRGVVRCDDSVWKAMPRGEN